MHGSMHLKLKRQVTLSVWNCSISRKRESYSVRDKPSQHILCWKMAGTMLIGKALGIIYYALAQCLFEDISSESSVE